MTKHDEQLKLLVVQEFEASGLGSRAVGCRHGVDEGTVRAWVARYRQHGVLGLRKKCSHYGAEFKLSVLQRMWREDLSCRHVAALFNLGGHPVVALWERQYHAGTLEPRRGRPRTMKTPPPTPPPEPEDTRTLKDLRKENERLRAEVAYLKKLDALIQAKQAAPRKRK
jgi:transposase